MRKKPRQARSREMVAALVLAAREVLEDRGLHVLTTNHVAARAGVSVGSLYQYFEDKDTLIDAVLEALQRELVVELEATRQRHLDSDLQTLTRANLSTVFDQFERHRGAYLQLSHGWYHARTMRAADTLAEYLSEGFRLYLLRHHDSYRFRNLPAALFVTINSAIFTGMRYLGQPHARIGREEVIDQLTRMLAGHLEREGLSSAPSGRPGARPRRPRRASSARLRPAD